MKYTQVVDADVGAGHDREQLIRSSNRQTKALIRLLANFQPAMKTKLDWNWGLKTVKTLPRAFKQYFRAESANRQQEIRTACEHVDAEMANLVLKSRHVNWLATLRGNYSEYYVFFEQLGWRIAETEIGDDLVFIYIPFRRARK